MKVRVIYKPDKSISVVHPAPNSRKAGETEEDWLKRVFDKATPPGCEYEDVEKSTLPSREDRDAWEGEKGKGITINQTKAKEIKDERKKRELIEEEKTKLAEESLKAKGLI